MRNPLLRALRKPQGSPPPPPPLTTAPNSPTALVGVASSNSIAYSWTAPAVDGTHSAATSYQMQTSADGATWADAGAATAQLSASIQGLTPSTVEYARVRAINSAGASGYSNVDTRSTTVAGATALDRMAAKGWGINQSGAAYFMGAYPYRNFVRQSVETWDNNAATTDANGWLTGLPAGGSATLRIIFGASYVPPGNYVIHTASGAFCTINDQSGQITSVVQGNNGARDCTFTVPNWPIGDQRYWTLTLIATVTNGTAAPINVNDLYLGFADYRRLR